MRGLRFFLGAAACLTLLTSAAAYGETQRSWPERLAVDFLNRDQQSVSVAVGRLHGVDSGMDFAVIDSVGRQVATFFPDEVRPERFWSSPLPSEHFGRVAVGQTVIRIRLAEDEAKKLRAEGRLLKQELDLAARREALRRFREDLAEADERINDLRVLGVRLARNRGDLEQELNRQRMSVEPRAADYDRQINELVGEWNEGEADRKVLLERKDAILRRPSPSQSDLDRVNRDLADYDRRLAQLQARLADLWEQRKNLLESVSVRTLQRLQDAVYDETVNQRAIAELEIRRKELAGEVEAAERELAEMEKAAP